MYNIRSIAFAAALGLSCGAMLGALPINDAAAAATITALEGRTDSGSIKSIDASNSRFVITIRDREVTVRVNEKTEYTLDGEKSTMAEALKVGANAQVTHEDYLASKVAVTSSKPE